MPARLYVPAGKRMLDMTLIIFALPLVIPLFIAAALAVKAGDGGPVFFRQKRAGLAFQPFFILKFRTMTENAERQGAQITAGGDTRITPVGKFLRAAKLDELPQLFNVLKGEMSLVGPRPEVARYVELFRQDYETVLSVRPGITDYAAIAFRNEEELLARCQRPRDAYVNEILPAKIALYKKYVAEISFLTDVKILAKTAVAVFCR
ncbi:MAG: sugar transferase [Elusimicrobiaceae bacterium]|nr:sugar transferase [Elusimicrobiaceae bacterium]